MTSADESEAATAAAVGAAVMGRFRDTLRRTQYLPPERMAVYQRGLLERLVRHARAHVPFYRDTGRLDPLFRGDAIDWGRWGEIPPLTRREVQNAGSALHSEGLTPEHGRTEVFSTSGSTGEPVVVIHSQLSHSLAWVAVMLRDYERHGVDPTGRLARLWPRDSAEGGIESIQKRDCWFAEFGVMGLFGERYDIADTRDARELVGDVVSLRPDVLLAQPIVLELMSAHDVQGRLGELGVAKLITVGDTMSREARTRVEDHFRCGSLDLYNSQECGQMASSCPHCGRYHVHSEIVVLEVVDGDGEPTAPGATGRVLATPLYNYAMPLIRYDHADQVEVGPEAACEIALPTLTTIYGKERTSFTFRGGVVIRPSVPEDAVREFFGARSFQIAQVADDRCEFRIVAGEIPESEMRFEEMSKLLRKLWWGGLQVDYRVVSSLTRGKYGKLKAIVREMADDANDG